jgi:transposase
MTEGQPIWDDRCRSRASRVVDVIHDRSAKTIASWLEKNPTIEFLSRDRSGLYAQAARQGAPLARQVADRFHLIQNLRLAIEQKLSYNDQPTRAVNCTPLDERLQLQQHRRMVRIGRRNVRLSFH